jgi:pimeloyl-ACP methyl ester carboxylesterase
MVSITKQKTMIKTFSKLAGVYLNTLAYLLPKAAARQGFNLFCRPFRTPVKEYHKKFFSTADLFSFDHDGIKIQGYRWGTGSKKILFLHGWQSHTFRWKNYIELLTTDDYSIYALDAPGHGLSQGKFLTVPYYSAVIQQLLGTLGPVHSIVAHSVGGFSALHAFHQQPSLSVEKLILMAPPGEASDFIKFYKNTLNLSGKTIDLILEHFHKELKNPIAYYSTAKFAAAVPVSGLIVHDEDDAETPYHYALKINENWKKSTLITTKGLGHNLKSKDVVAQVVTFIAQPTPQPFMEVTEGIVAANAADQQGNLNIYG